MGLPRGDIRSAGEGAAAVLTLKRAITLGGKGRATNGDTVLNCSAEARAEGEGGTAILSRFRTAAPIVVAAQRETSAVEIDLWSLGAVIKMLHSIVKFLTKSGWGVFICGRLHQHGNRKAELFSRTARFSLGPAVCLSIPMATYVLKDCFIIIIF